MSNQGLHSMDNQEAPATKAWVGAGLLAALGASLCCITPLLAIMAGTSGLAAPLSWLEPFRPYLIGVTALVLGCAWYQKLKPARKVDCDCETKPKPNFMQSKSFLSLVTVFAAVMLTFPSYAHVLPSQQQVAPYQANVQTVEIKIKEMTCAGCEAHVNSEVNKLAGVLKVGTSYANGNTLVQFNKPKADVKQIWKAASATGFKVTETRRSNGYRTPVTVSCPSCSHQKEEHMPTDACQYFYQCEQCEIVLKPKQGDCCVFCSYGTAPCPPVQEDKSCCG